MNQRYAFVIDGNFFARRAMSHLIDEGMTFQPATIKKDEKKLLEDLSLIFSSTIRASKPYISSIIMAKDYGSWRKEHNVIRPKEDVSEKVEYKETRKQDEEINWKGVYGIVDRFHNVLEKDFNIPTIKFPGAEGDDVLYATSRIYNANGQKVMLWTSDGDMNQVVNEHTVIYKLPKKKIIVATRYKKDFTQEDKDIFDYDPTSLNKLVIESGTEVEEANPFEVVLEMITYGQEKDNIPSLFFWKSNGDKPRTMRPSISHIKKALAAIGHPEFPSDLEFDLLYDDAWIKKYVIAILAITKQQRDVDHTIQVFLSNRKLCYLNKKEIPETVLSGIIGQLKAKIPGLKQDTDIICEWQNIYNKFELTEAGSIFENFLG